MTYQSCQPSPCHEERSSCHEEKQSYNCDRSDYDHSSNYCDSHSSGGVNILSNDFNHSLNGNNILSIV